MVSWSHHDFTHCQYFEVWFINTCICTYVNIEGVLSLYLYTIANSLFFFLYSHSVCVIHHFERIGKKINIFDSFWLTVVTFSTVGYGDVYPGHWMGKFFMMIFIISALVYLPSKVNNSTYVCVCIQMSSMFICIYTYMYIWIYAYMYIYTCTCACLHTKYTMYKM